MLCFIETVDRIGLVAPFWYSIYRNIELRLIKLSKNLQKGGRAEPRQASIPTSGFGQQPENLLIIQTGDLISQMVLKLFNYSS